jgi:hypothetical protein
LVAVSNTLSSLPRSSNVVARVASDITGVSPSGAPVLRMATPFTIFGNPWPVSGSLSTLLVE